MAPYYMLVASLPHLPPFEQAERLAINRERLEQRLRSLDAEHLEDLVLAGRVASDFIADRDAEVLVSAELFGEPPEDPAEMSQARERSRRLILGITSDMLREGIELVPSSAVTGGARVRAVGDDAEVDLSDEAVSELLFKHMLPRFQAILSGDDV